MTKSWPHIGPRELRELWDRYAPRFLRLDDVDQELPKVREQFLRWLVSTGVDLDDGLARRKAGRLKLEEVALTRRNGSAEAVVTMSLAGDAVTTSRLGDAEPNSILQLAASVTLEAVSKLAPVFDFGLKRAFVESWSPDSIAISVVHEEHPERVHGLVGAAPVVSAPHEAMVRATLDAINRQVTFGMQDQL